MAACRALSIPFSLPTPTLPRAPGSSPAHGPGPASHTRGKLCLGQECI